ncbi:hypothetical protein ABZ820_15720 [Streptomyces diacarni]|uniref:hypothetical protein n=1 Tax=Streptomyces diacarni TaxID=2800381 RepID=UPI0033E26B70
MPDHRDVTLRRLMYDRLRQHGSPARAMRSEFLLNAWKTTSYPQRAALLTQLAWRARDRTLNQGNSSAQASVYAVELRDAARRTDGCSDVEGCFAVRPDSLPKSPAVQLEAGLLLLAATTPAEEPHGGLPCGTEPGTGRAR